MDQGTVQIYCGDGSGKSSAALGQGIRLASNGGTVYMIQFLKVKPTSDFLSRLEPELKFFRFERSPMSYDDMTDEERDEEKKHIQNGINFARKVLTTGECDLLVLDEVLGAVDERILTEDEVIDALEQRPPETSVILTGRKLPERIARMADCISTIGAVQSTKQQ